MAKKKKSKPKTHSNPGAIRPAASAASAPRIRPLPAPPRLLDELEAVHDLIARQQWQAALPELVRLNRAYPRREEVLTALAHVAQKLRDEFHLLPALEELAPMRPDDGNIAMLRASLYLGRGWPALGLRTFREFLERWPEHPEAAHARETVRTIEPVVAELLREEHFEGEGGFELALLHDRVQLMLATGKYPEARKLAEELWQRRPDFFAALNNMSQAYYAEGKLSQALATQARVLDTEPDNIHALSNLVRYSCLSGDLKAAWAYAARLKASRAAAYEPVLKVVEGLSFLGDDAGIWEVIQAATDSGKLEETLDKAMLFHLAAVAGWRLGHEAEARSFWQRSLRENPGFILTRQNLDDLKAPPAERHAPWPFPFEQYVRGDLVEEVVRLTQHLEGRNAEASRRTAGAFVARHPELESLVPLLLDHGDQLGRTFALTLASTARTPSLLQSLRDYALGQRGPDAMRYEAAGIAVEAGLIPGGKARLWWHGEWRELLIMGLELHDDAVVKHPPRVNAIAEQALHALQAATGTDAERLLREALTLEPDAPDLATNLAAAFLLQGRTEESNALMEETHNRHPGYSFARLGVVRLRLQHGDLEGARQLLDAMYQHKRLHYSELAQWALAEVDWHLAKGDVDGARSWLELWQQSDPDHPALTLARAKIAKATVRGLLPTPRLPALFPRLRRKSAP